MKSQLERPSAKVLEWEVLPPEEKRKRAQLEPLFRWLARIMDEFLRLPGTRFRFGLDPILGLLPGVGDTASAIISALALLHAARCGLPKIVLARMSLNILINEIVGIIPGIGDAFSFWFKSNARNYRILQEHTTGVGKARRSDWIFVIAVLLILFVIVAAGIMVSFFVLRELAKFLSLR
jgi:Domain of unknown function (DUF4112)